MVIINVKTKPLKCLLDRCSGHTVDLKKELAVALDVHYNTVQRYYEGDNMDTMSLVTAGRLVAFLNENKVAGLDDVTLADLYAK